MCEFQHEFSITLSNLNNGRWCATCSQSKMEWYTRKLIEAMTGHEFIKIRPDWLLNNRGNRMEIDMYNKDLNLAIEYNGVQHYKFIRHFFKDESDFE